jgi:lipopolysaccharide/colanic/teichoic acid biosynthesis glycosyltransferase
VEISQHDALERPGNHGTRGCAHHQVGRDSAAHQARELPQFLNVLAGDMTLVGPRPESAEFVSLYTREQRAVLKVKPGVTGQVQLASGDESDWIPEGVRPDEYYIEHSTFTTRLKVALKCTSLQNSRAATAEASPRR